MTSSLPDAAYAYPSPLEYRAHEQSTASKLQLDRLVQWVAVAWLCLAFMPLAKSDVLDQGLTPSRLIEIGLLCMGFGLTALVALVKPTWKTVFNRKAFWITSAFWIWAMLSAAWSPARLLTFAKAGELGMITLAAALLGSWATVQLRSSRSLITLIALSLLAVVFFLLAFNVLTNGTPIPLSGEAEGIDSGRPRLMLGFAHPLVGADLLALTMITLLASELHLLLKAPLFLMMGGLYALTQPRSSLGGFLCAITVVVMFRIKRKDIRALFVIGMLLVAAAVVVVAIDNPKLVFDTAVPQDAATLNGRTDLWSYVLTLIVKRPILGYGYFSSRFFLLDVFSWAGHCHNSYLEIALSTGMVGLAIFAVFTAHVIRVAIRTRDTLLLAAAAYCYSVALLDPLVWTPGIPTVILMISIMRAGAVMKQERSGPRHHEMFPHNGHPAPVNVG